MIKQGEDFRLVQKMSTQGVFHEKHGVKKDQGVRQDIVELNWCTEEQRSTWPYTVANIMESNSNCTSKKQTAKMRFILAKCVCFLP